MEQQYSDPVEMLAVATPRKGMAHRRLVCAQFRLKGFQILLGQGLSRLASVRHHIEQQVQGRPQDAFRILQLATKVMEIGIQLAVEIPFASARQVGAGG
jgi:hypothetical protein